MYNYYTSRLEQSNFSSDALVEASNAACWVQVQTVRLKVNSRAMHAMKIAGARKVMIWNNNPNILATLF